MTLARKMPEFYMIIGRKIFLPIFFWGGGHMPPSCPPLVHLWPLTSVSWWNAAQWGHTSVPAISPRLSHTTLRTKVQWDDVWLHSQREACIRIRPHHHVDWQPVQLDHRVSLSNGTWTHVAMPTQVERNICHHNSSVCWTPYHQLPTSVQLNNNNN